MTLPAGTMLPSELERKQIFFTLKRWSSLTAWNRILGYYRAWGEAAEASVKEAADKGLEAKTSVPYSDYVLILKGLADFDEGVNRLRQGDKRVFRSRPVGEFVKGCLPTGFWPSITSPHSRWGDMQVFDTEHTPNAAAFAQTLLDLCSAIGESWPDIIEDEKADDAPTCYGVWMQEWLPKMTFPDPLPEVPDPKQHTLVRTGGFVPCSGIWEPVDVPGPTGVMSLFSKPRAPEGPLPAVGTMNYLHRATPAPKACVETETDNIDIDVSWRLLWKDTRYEDGTVPEEEQHYVFLQPEVKAEPVKPAVRVAADPLTTAHSGQPAPVAGRWLVEDDLFGAVQLQKGEELSMHKGRKVRWVLAKP